jgi:hypothetical protein
MITTTDRIQEVGLKPCEDCGRYFPESRMVRCHKCRGTKVEPRLTDEQVDALIEVQGQEFKALPQGHPRRSQLIRSIHETNQRRRSR